MKTKTVIKGLSLLVAAVLLGIGPAARATMLFLAEYNGNTGNAGLDANYAVGSATVLSTSGVSLAPGRFNTGANFPSGDSGSVYLQYSAANNIHNNIGSVDFWWKPSFNSSDLLSLGNLRLLDVRNTTGTRFVDLFLSDSNGAAPGGARLNLFSAQMPAISLPIGGGSFSAGDDISVALTWDNTAGVRLFVNGSGTANGGSWAANSATQDVIFVGGFLGGGALDAYGVIDELRVTDEFLASFTPPDQPYFAPEPSVAGLLMIGGALAMGARKKMHDL